MRAGEPLFTLEGEKATQDIEAIDGGILEDPARRPRRPATTVGRRRGDRLSARARRESELPGPCESAAIPVKAIERCAAPLSGSAPAWPIVRPTGRRSSPLARRLARELGIDWTRLAGSGSTGRIRKVDVLAAVQARAGMRQARTQPLRRRPLALRAYP